MIPISEESLTGIVRSNLAQYFGQPLSAETIDLLARQISETVAISINKLIDFDKAKLKSHDLPAFLAGFARSR